MLNNIEEKNINQNILSENIDNPELLNNNENNDFDKNDKNEIDIWIITKYDTEKKLALVVDIKNKFEIWDFLKLKNRKDEFEFEIDTIINKEWKKIKIMKKKYKSCWINIPKDPWETAYLTRKKWKLEEFIEFLRDLIIILLIVIIIRTYIASPFQISWNSMEKSYHNKEFILVNKFSYAQIWNFKIWDPIRWDVVIFRPHASNWKEFYIKRIIWMPNDTIKIENWEVYIKKWGATDFIKLNEDYLDPINKWSTFLWSNTEEKIFVIPEWEYFLMWDNRNNSSDSRSCFMSCFISWSSHFIKRNDIIWKVFLDFGYFNILEISENKIKLWTLKWIHYPRFLNTTKTWTYYELE